MESLWRLPGPSRFVETIARDLGDGASVVLRFGPNLPAALDDHMEQHCRRRGYRWTTAAASGGIRPLSLIRTAAGLDSSAAGPASWRRLVLHESLQHRVFWIDGLTPADWPRWRRFLLSYAHARRNAVTDAGGPPIFVAPLCGPGFQDDDLADPMLSYREFRDAVDRDDLLMLALQNPNASGRNRAIRSLFANTVAQLAQWDLVLARRLLDGGPDAAFEPRPILEDYARERGWTDNTPEAWVEGTLDGPRDRPIIHSALLLVQGREAELNRRLWAAQAAVLMPLLEERRAELVHRHRHRFRLPFETEIGVFEKPEDLEIGLLVHYFSIHKAEGRGLTAKARKLRNFRNKLAHLEPLSPREATHPILLNPIA